MAQRQYLDRDRLEHVLDVDRLPALLHRPVRELAAREARRPWT